MTPPKKKDDAFPERFVLDESRDEFLPGVDYL